MVHAKGTVLFGVVMAIFLLSAAWAQSAEQGVVPAPIAALHGITELEFCGEPVPLHEQGVRERLEKELLLSVWDRPQVIIWLKR